MPLAEALAEWSHARPSLRGSLPRDAAGLSAWHRKSLPWLDELAQSGTEAIKAKAQWRETVRLAHTLLFQRHRAALSELVDLEGDDDPVAQLGEAIPGLAPSAEELEQDAGRFLAEKIGFEYKAALLVSSLLDDPDVGRKLLARARRPSAAALRWRSEFELNSALDLGKARIRSAGEIAHLEIVNPDTLNAEDESVLNALETCVDLMLLHPRIKIGVLRGGPVTSSKYAGRRVFCSGLDLTGLHAGRLPHAYYVRRELGLVAKLQCGLHLGDGIPDIEKPWIAAVDTHAIGGGFQLLLVSDYAIATRGAIFSLPARQEGIIPGAANLRLPRRIGECAARRALLLGTEIACGSEQGRQLIDEIVEPQQMETAIQRAADRLLSSGWVSLAGNRRALRLAQEPIDQFRTYMAHFALAQADCHFSAELVQNLEQHWLSRRARPASFAEAAADA